MPRMQSAQRMLSNLGRTEAAEGIPLDPMKRGRRRESQKAHPNRNPESCRHEYESGYFVRKKMAGIGRTRSLEGVSDISASKILNYKFIFYPRLIRWVA
jgi:hypothetical protein